MHKMGNMIRKIKRAGRKRHYVTMNEKLGYGLGARKKLEYKKRLAHDKYEYDLKY